MNRQLHIIAKLTLVMIAVGGVYSLDWVSIMDYPHDAGSTPIRNDLKYLKSILDSGMIVESRTLERWTSTPEVVEAQVQDWIEHNFELDGFRNVRLLESDVSNKDRWGNTYRCRTFPSAFGKSIEFYSLGRDGLSLSRGYDEDDIASWWCPSGGDVYFREANLKHRIAFAPVWVLLVAIGVAGVRWAFMQS